MLGPELNPASSSREWLILTHNGMADMRQRGVNQGRCLNCFQPGKDVVIPFPPGTIGARARARARPRDPSPPRHRAA